MFQVLFIAITAAFQWALPRLLGVVGTVVVSSTVITPIFDYLKSMFMSKLNGMPADVLAFLNFGGVTDAVSIVFAAYALKISIKSAKSAFSKSSAGAK